MCLISVTCFDNSSSKHKKNTFKIDPSTWFKMQGLAEQGEFNSYYFECEVDDPDSLEMEEKKILAHLKTKENVTIIY